MTDAVARGLTPQEGLGGVLKLWEGPSMSPQCSRGACFQLREEAPVI